jgi:hypothetical protein
MKYASDEIGRTTMMRIREGTVNRGIRVATVVAGLMTLIAPGAPVDARQPADRLVLITLDGARTQEIFGGLDLDVLKSAVRDGQKVEETNTYKQFWAATADERRRKLMPFFWTLVTQHGSIAGNQELGSVVRLSNRHWFSYPGYAEILLGEAHDDLIKSNDPIRNPFVTVLEELRRHLNVTRDDVATFASWSVFNAIVEHTEGATFASAGVEDGASTRQDVALLNQLQRQVQAPWEGIRFDAFTFGLAMAHLESARPRVLYLAFDETDDWAHDGRYDRVLEAYARTDRYLEQLWTWLQNQNDYRGRTHVLITTDHGRGRTTADWRNHGAKVDGAQDVWLAFASSRMPQRGEWRGGPALSTSQIAATIAGWMGLDWNTLRPNAGVPIR